MNLPRPKYQLLELDLLIFCANFPDKNLAQIANIFASWNVDNSPVEQRNRDKASEIEDKLFPGQFPQGTLPATNDPFL